MPKVEPKLREGLMKTYNIFGMRKHERKEVGGGKFGEKSLNTLAW